MKKISIFVLAIVAFVGLAQAQYKPEKGSFTTELQFSPFNLSVNDETGDYSTGPFSTPGFRFRYFFNEKLALRTTLGLNFDHDKISHDYEFDIYNYDLGYQEMGTGNYTMKNKYTTFSIAPGLEYHFGDWDRMSLYVGGELLFGVRTSKNTLDGEREAMLFTRDYYAYEYNIYVGSMQSTTSVETKNCVADDWQGAYIQNGIMFFGINAVFGMDFYVYKGLYLGAELGLGYTYETYLNGSIEGSTTAIFKPISGAPVTETNSINEKIEDDLSAGNFGFKCNPMIRLGWRF